MMDLLPKHLEEVQAILRQYLSPGSEVWAFGSRVNGMAAEGSDLDLIVRSADGAGVVLTGLRAAFRDSNLPFKVELLDWAAIPDCFRNEICNKYVVVQAVLPDELE
jgi:predicted nucleotidyltransferase